MEIFIGIILLIIILIIRINYKNNKRKEKLRQKRILEEQKQKIALAEAERKRKEEEEKKRLEELKYENLTVVYETIDNNGKPEAIAKRKNNTYVSIERQAKNVTPFILGEILKLEKETINKWNWYDETEYKKRLEKYKTEELIRKKKAELEFTKNHKENWLEFRKKLEQNNIKKLYHFTDRKNLKSIKSNGGLFSWHYCEANNIEIPKAGGIGFGRDLDRYYGLENYVRLSFTKQHPMLYIAMKESRITDPVILEIDVSVVYLKETRFSNMNATKTGHKQGKTFDDLKRIRFDLVCLPNHFDISEEEKHFYQAEVLVLERVPLKYITNINEV